MTVNVGTIGHIDPVAVIRKCRGALAIALAVNSQYGAAPKLPAPKPAKRLTAADLERIEAAEAKRQRRAERNRKQGGAS